MSPTPTDLLCQIFVEGEIEPRTSGGQSHFRRIGRMRGAPGAGIEVKGVEHRYELYSLHTGSLHHDDEVMKSCQIHTINN